MFEKFLKYLNPNNHLWNYRMRKHLKKGHCRPVEGYSNLMFFPKDNGTCKFNVFKSIERTDHWERIHCKKCGRLLFKIDLRDYTIEVIGNKPHTKFYGNSTPLLKHVDITTTCDQCKDVITNTF